MIASLRGRLVAGVVVGLRGLLIPPLGSLALGPGVLGGFTTVSAWAGQVRGLADAGHTGLAGLYLVVTLAAGLFAAALGQHVAHRRDRS